MEVHRLLMAIRKHVKQMDVILRAPPMVGENRRIVQSISELERAAELVKRPRPRRKAQR